MEMTTDVSRYILCFADERPCGSPAFTLNRTKLRMKIRKMKCSRQSPEKIGIFDREEQIFFLSKPLLPKISTIMAVRVRKRLTL